MFCKILGYDIKRGILNSYKGHILTVLLSIFICISFACEYTKFYELKSAHYLDILFFAFAGSPKFVPGKDMPFVFPLFWATIFLLPLYLSSYYPFYDLIGYGKTILIQSGSRYKWWLSKTIWCILRIAAYFLTIYLVALVFCLVMGIPVKYSVTENAHSMVINSCYKADVYAPGEYALLGFNGQMGILFLLAPVVVLSVLSIIQMTISLLSTPVYGFLLSAVILVSSTYYLHPLFIGNYLMVLRSDRLFSGGVNDVSGSAISLILIVLVTAVNLMIFKKYDILANVFKDE